jgi:chondroitin AC lyase
MSAAGIFTHCVLAWLSLVVLCAAQVPERDSTSSKILVRYRQILLETPAPEEAAIRGILNSLSADGTWPDLNYSDKHPSAWSPKEHLVRIRSLTQALLASDHALRDDAAVFDALNRAIDHWLEKRYRCSNWWWNEIGTPQAMRDVAVLLDQRLQGDRRQGVLEVIAQSRVHGSGANLLWQAELAFHLAALRGDETQMAKSAEQIWSEIKVGAAEGIQTDWSFYQHGPRPHSFGYGRSFLDIAVNLAWQLRDTPWSMPSEKQAIISNYLLEGLQWMCRGTYCPPGTFDRVISRQHSKDAAALTPILRRWAEVERTRQGEVDRFIAHQQHPQQRPLGFRHFPQADFTAYHHTAGSIFLKTISSRTLPTESIIGENLKGVPYLSSGDHYVVRDGSEFFDLQPVLCWDRLPGLTVPQADSRQQRMQFVGGSGNGTSGMVAMDFVRSSGKQQVIALRKAWFFHGDMMLCLMSAPSFADADGPVVTSIEQCRLRGKVIAQEANSEPRTLAEGAHRLENASWILHNETGYVPLYPSQLDVELGPVKGSWSSISSRYKDPPDNIVDSVFRVQFQHSSNRPSGYRIVLGTNEEALREIAGDLRWQILRNDRDCQAIHFKDGLTFAAFYKAGSVTNSEQIGSELEVKHPCLTMWTAEELWMCDPTHLGAKTHVVWDGNSFTLELLPRGLAAKIDKKNQH